jgi:hypothetical protein
MQATKLMSPAQQLRQLGDIGCNPACLVAGEQVGCCSLELKMTARNSG